MTTVPHRAATLQEVLTTRAAAAARRRGLVQRASTLTGAVFVQALVVGWLVNPQASREARAPAVAAVGVAITPHGRDPRVTAAAAVFVEEVRGAARRAVVLRAGGPGGDPAAGAVSGGGVAR